MYNKILNFLYCVPVTVITLIHLAFVTFLNQIDTRKIEILTSLALSQGAKMSDPNLYDFLSCVSVTDLHLYTCGTVGDLFRCRLVEILMS